MNVNDLMTLRAAGAVRRMHTQRARAQTVAEHSWGVAMLLLTVYPDAPAGLIQMALVHDLPELRTGDVPAPTKWASPDMEKALRTLEDNFHARYRIRPEDYGMRGEDFAVLKWCDGAELLLFCVEELYAGNRYAIEVMLNIADAIGKRDVPPKCVSAWNYVRTQMSVCLTQCGGCMLPGNVPIYKD